MHENPTWSTAYKNQLPDSAFLYVDKRACEHTDREGRSHPLSCRHFPYRNHLGTVSLSHVRNAISRAPQSNLPSSVQREVQQKARRLLDREGRMAANRKGSSMSRSTNLREGSSRRRGINGTMGAVRRNPGTSSIGPSPRRHLGKFDTPLDEAIYAASLDGFDDGSVGDATEPPFTHATLMLDGSSLAEYIDPSRARSGGIAYILNEQELQFLRTKGAAGVIVFVNSDGFVQVVYYDNAQELEKDWAETEEKLSGGGDFQENPTRGARGEQASRAKFENLRRRYIGARAALTDAQLELGWRYGHARGWESYLKAAEKRKLERLRAATDRESGKFFDYLESISPRDWSYGVPSHWVIEQLSYDDAVRPVEEPLSVVPPLSHGATVPRQ